MRTSGETLLSLIEEILDFSKIEAGRIDLAARPFVLAAFVEEAVELLGPRAQAKGLEICCYVDERLPVRVVGDAARLRQVLFNLAGNAIKFTDRGGVSIIVEPDTQPDAIAISVRDTGIGISADDQARIFRGVRAGRRRLGTKIRRHRPGPDHFQADHREHGRHDRGREHARSGRYLPRQHSAARASAIPTSRACLCPILPATTC